MLFAAALSLLLLAARGEAQESSQPPNPIVSGVVQVADHIKLPAREPGVLIHLGVKEGSLVRGGQKIGQIDDSEPQMQKKAAGYAVAGAIKRWKDDVDIRYSDAAAAVAQKDYEKMREANELAEKAYADTDVRRAKLEWDKMVFAAEKARKEQELAKFEAYTKQAELEAANLAIDRRVITAPFDGVVEELARKQDEWVNPGDTILQLFRMDTMHVEGAVDQSQYDPHEIQGCEVTVEVPMARGRSESFRGRITKVSAIVRGDRVYDVRAEVVNRQEHGSWLLRDGLEATMTIHLGTGGAAAAGVSRAR
jgi:multidrug efflux pump subunit AcrA (membrane-fusion protein)